MARRSRKQRGARQPRQPKERKIAGTGSIVTNFRQASRASLKGATLHQTKRSPDGWSAIDLERVHLNEVWVGTGMHILKDVNTYMKDVVEPTFKNSSGSPFCTIILGASPEYFRPHGGEPGEEDPARLEAWKTATKAWIVETFGDDLVSAIYNGDETTPHVHLAICPTYLKKSRKPDRKKPGEDDLQFAQRLQDWHAETGEKTLSWSSNEVLGRYNSFGRLRQSYAEAMKPLGLEYSLASFEPAKYPEPKSKKEHLIELEDQNEVEAARLAAEAERIEHEREALEQAQAEAMARALEDARIKAKEQSERIIARAKRAAATIEARAQAKALRAEEERKQEWDQKLMELAARERAAEEQRHQLEARMSWMSLAIANLNAGIEAAIDGLFCTPASPEDFPDTKTVDDLFQRREGNPDHGDWLEYKSTHNAAGDALPLPSGLQSMIARAFTAIREFAVSLLDQHKTIKRLDGEIRSISRMRASVAKEVNAADAKLKKQQQAYQEALKEEQALEAQIANQQGQADQLDRQLSCLTAAHDEAVAWANRCKGARANAEDHRKAQDWIDDWTGGKTPNWFSPKDLALRLQNSDYKKALAELLGDMTDTGDLFSDDIRLRWQNICALPKTDLNRVMECKGKLDNDSALQRATTTDAKDALALTIARERASNPDNMPDLARQFLGLPEDLQSQVEVVVSSKDRKIAETPEFGM